jgi:hypothetical protein
MRDSQTIGASSGRVGGVDDAAPNLSVISSANAVLAVALLIFSSLFTSGCNTPGKTAALTAGVVVGATVVGANSPANELEQVYYLGVFDPNEQLPTSIYRVRVHGQSSAISSIRFASGWVPAKLVDSLSDQVSLDPNSSSPANIVAAINNQEANLQTNRRLWVFGPEGFRVVPEDYRLTIVMSADPSQYFAAIDQMLGITAGGSQTVGNSSQLQGNLLLAYQKLLAEREQLQRVTPP